MRIGCAAYSYRDYLKPGGGMTIEHGSDPNHYAVTTLTGRLVNQSALVGVLNALHDIGCPILSVERMETE